MKKIFAIAFIAVRNAIRSRMVLFLLGVLVLITVGLPLTIQGDGTAAGQVQILLKYTLGFARFVLGLAILWAGCASVSQEIADKQIHLIVTKPVQPLQIWAGKWLGLAALTAIMLGFCGLAAYAMLRWSTQSGNLASDEETILRNDVLVARRSVPPEPESVDEAARKELEERAAQHLLPENIRMEDAFREIRRQHLIRANSIESGQKKTWVFRLPGRIDPTRELLLRYRIASSLVYAEAVSGIWRIGGTEIAQDISPGGQSRITFPASAVKADNTVEVEYSNVNTNPVTVLFPPDDGLELLVYEGTFEANYFRSLLLIFFDLCFLAAIGVTAGSLFSMPVAAFASIYLLILLNITGFLHELATPEGLSLLEIPSAIPEAPVKAALGFVYKSIYFVVKPLDFPNPLDLVSSGHMVSWELVGRVFAIQAVLYTAALAALGTGVIRRREMAIPAQE